MRDDKSRATNELKDYASVYENLFSLMGGDFSLQSFKDSLSASPVKTVQEYFQESKKDHLDEGDTWIKRFKADMDRHPARVRRLNELAQLTNSCHTIRQLMAINSEVKKLLNGDKSGR